MWALRRLEIRLLQCVLCFYLSFQICDAAQQQKDVSTKNTGNMRPEIIKIKCLCWWICVPRIHGKDATCG